MMVSRALPQPAAIAGPAGSIEAIVEDPGGAADMYAVVCHPHPLHGGTMDNKVVTTLARGCHDGGVPTVRFNFRGVGSSEGAFDGGQGETADAQAVAEWGAQRWSGRGLLLAGFSFGAYVALRLAQQRPVRQLITVAPPVGRFDFTGLQAPAARWIIVQGDADEVVDPAAVRAWAACIDPEPRLELLAGVGHFFHGRLNELRDIVGREIRSG
jgi:alpha/beta superfamily hydrolase